MTTIRVASYNLLDLYKQHTPKEQARWHRVYQVIRELNADVLAVQELIAPAEGGMTALQRLADVVDMVPGVVARGHQISPHDQYFWVGLLWQPEISMVTGSGRDYEDEMWHNLVTADIDLDDAIVKVGSYHAPPFGRSRRSDEAERVVSALTRPRPAIPGIVGGDWNGLSADRVQNSVDGSWSLYDYRDPYNGPGVEWTESMVYQCTWEYTGRGERRWRADRSAGDVLWSGGLSDVRAVLGTPCTATAGHWAGDPFSPRAIDLCRANVAMLPAVTEHEVITTADEVSDHRPVVTTLDLSRLTQES